MYGDEQAFIRWLDSLTSKFGREAVDDLHAALIGRLAKMARRHDQDMLDMEAARLIPLGASVVVQAQGVCRATAYNRAERGAVKLSKQSAHG